MKLPKSDRRYGHGAEDLKRMAKLKYDLLSSTGLPDVSLFELLLREQKRSEIIQDGLLKHLVPEVLIQETDNGEFAAFLENREEPSLIEARNCRHFHGATAPRLRRRGVCTHLYKICREATNASRVQTSVVPTASAVGLLKSLEFRQHSGWHPISRLFKNDTSGLLGVTDYFGFREELKDSRLLGLRLGELKEFLLRPATIDDLGAVTQLRVELATLLGYSTHWEPVEHASHNILVQPEEKSRSQLYVVTDNLDKVVGTARVIPFWNTTEGLWEVQIREVILDSSARGRGLLRWIFPGLVHFTRRILHGKDVYSWYTREHAPFLVSSWVPGEKLTHHYLRELHGFSQSPLIFAENL